MNQCSLCVRVSVLFLFLAEVSSDSPKAEILRLEGEKLRRENRDEDSLAKFQEALGLDMKLAKVSFLLFWGSCCVHIGENRRRHIGESDVFCSSMDMQSKLFRIFKKQSNTERNIKRSKA
jgi:hypothetical protein